MRIEFVLDTSEREHWQNDVVPKLAVCRGHEKVLEPRWCAMNESVSFVMTDHESDGHAEAQLSFWGEPFMAQVTGHEVPRYIFHVHGHFRTARQTCRARAWLSPGTVMIASTLNVAFPEGSCSDPVVSCGCHAEGRASRAMFSPFAPVSDWRTVPASPRDREEGALLEGRYYENLAIGARAHSRKDRLDGRRRNATPCGRRCL
jgi:hypothetical protein